MVSCHGLYGNNTRRARLLIVSSCEGRAETRQAGEGERHVEDGGGGDGVLVVGSDEKEVVIPNGDNGRGDGDGFFMEEMKKRTRGRGKGKDKAGHVWTVTWRRGGDRERGLGLFSSLFLF